MEKKYNYNFNGLSSRKSFDTFDSIEFNSSISDSTGSKDQLNNFNFKLKNNENCSKVEENFPYSSETINEDLINIFLKNGSSEIYQDYESKNNSDDENQLEMIKEKSIVDSSAFTLNSATASKLLPKNIEESEKRKKLNEEFLNSKALGKSKLDINYDMNKFFTGHDIYKMQSRPRGFCLIINNVDFPTHRKRKGSDLEAEYLKLIFEQLGFKVLIYQNQTAEAMKEIFEDVSKRPELKNHDAFVSFISSHGDGGRIVFGSNGFSLKVDSVLSFYTNSKCPHLKDKPKLFFIQSCRGSNHDYGTYDTQKVFDSIAVEKLSATRNKLENADRLSDVLVVYSTLDGFVSIRNELTGSWFGDALGSVLRDHSDSLELQQLLCCINRKILSREKGEVHQVIESNYFGFKKRFYFNPGHFSS